MVESISKPGSPGRSSSSAASTACVASSVLAQGYFCTISIRPGPSLMTASPNSGQVSVTTSATSLSTSGVPSLFFLLPMGTCASSFGVTIGERDRICTRCVGVSMKPPVPMTAPLANCKMPTSNASAVVCMTSSTETLCAAIRFGSTCTCGILIRSPQIATLATPGTRSNRARIVQYAIMDMSVSGMVLDDSPIFMNRLVTETGGIITGGAAQVGNMEMMLGMRSNTSCRARSSSVPGLNSISMDDKSEMLFERIRSNPSTPFKPCSMGTLTMDSTSSAESPKQIVWISTRVGANSGKTSTGIRCSCVKPNNIIAAAISRTIWRNLRLVPTIERIMAGALPVPDSFFLELDFGSVQLGRADGHDGGPGGWTVRQHRQLTDDVIDRDRMPHVDERLGIRVRPGVALGVVQDRGVRDHPALRPLDFLVADGVGLDLEPLHGLLGQRHARRLRTVQVLDHGGLRFIRVRRRMVAARELHTESERYDEPPAIIPFHDVLPDARLNCSTHRIHSAAAIPVAPARPANACSRAMVDKSSSGAALTPALRKSVGSTYRSTNNEVARPPRMTTAIGRTISNPGPLPKNSAGSSASPAASVTMMVGASRSRAPRSTSSGPKASPSRLSKR